MRITNLLAVMAVVMLPAPVAPAAAAKVVLNEIHYHPGDDARTGEFVELHNHGAEAADLGSWILRGGIEFFFPSGTTLAAGEYLVVAADPPAIVARYSMDPKLVIGPYQRTLSNGGEDLELLTDDGYLMSFANFRDTAPWPETPDGLGPSLERVSPLREEHDAEAWAASIIVGGTPGAPNSVRVEDPAPPPAGSPFIPRGATWKFFRGRSEPPADWNAAGFGDAAWESGPAGFGYDDGDDATVLNDMRTQYTTVYVRRTFDVPNPAAVQSMSLSVLYDDGYVAYLNGVEVDRFNVAGAAGTRVPFNAVTTGFVEPPVTRVLDISSSRSLLVTGTNVLAVEGVNRALDNADFSLHPSLDGTTQAGGRQPITFIGDGSSWQFFRGTTAPPSSWRDISFVDDAWESGAAGIGYGDGDDATVLDDMLNGYLTVFARQRFQVTDAAQVVSLALLVDYDDGFIAYLNGVEVARSNVAAAGFDAPASGSREAGTPEEFTIAAPVSALRTGINVLAIEGHNSDLLSSDFSLAPALEGELATGGGTPIPDLAPARPPRDVVLNEVLTGGTGWVEIFNTTGAAVDAGGRRIGLFPPSLGSYTIPVGTSVPARGSVVIDESQLGFTLATAPVLILSTSDDRFIDAINPRTTPAGMSTGRWPDGVDNRYVFPSPSRNAPNALSLESRVVINEIQYHPAASNTGGEIIELHNRGSQAVDVAGWSFTRGIEYTIPANTTIPAGGFLVIARDPGTAQAYYGILAPLGPYAGQLKGGGETILLRDALNNTVDRVRYADEGSWPPGPDGTGPSLELVHPALDNRYGPAWRASTGHGTPGAANSARVSDPAPTVAGVEHAPVVPAPVEDVLVTASVSDERGITSATLFWRVDGAGGNPAQLAMTDDGLNDDGVASNGVYGARIPAQPDRTIVLFWIQATAQGGQTVTAPATAPSPSFLYQVESTGPDQIRPTYRVIMTAANLQSLRTRGTGSNVLLDCTFVSGGRARYNRGIRYRGSSARSCSPLSYRVQFDHDVDLEGIKDLNVNGCNAQRQWIGLDFLSRTGLPTPECWFRKLSLNGALEPEVFLRVEAIEEPFIERVLPTADEGGNIYRGENQANLDYRGTSFGSYQNDYEKHSNEAEADWSDVVDLCFRFDADTTSSADFPAAIEEVVDIDEWALFFAAFAILASSENSILLNNGDDYFLYHRPSDGKWMLLPWDLDSCFDEAQQVLFRPTVDQIERFLEHPRYAPLYWCSLEWLFDTAFQSDVVEARIDHLAPLFSAARISQLRQFLPARRDYIGARLSRDLTLAVTSGGSLCGDKLLATAGSASLQGLAPGCGTTEVRVNGQGASYDPQATAWTATLAIAGAGPLSITANDRNGIVVARMDLTVRPPLQGTLLPASISSSRALTRGQSPFVVSGATTVQTGVTVTIEPGVTLLFDQAASLVVDGKLVAEGTTDELIRFQAESCGENQAGIVLRGSGPGTRLAYCEVTGLSRPQGYAAAVTVDGPSVVFDHATLDGPAGGLALEVRSTSSITFENSLVRSGGAGIRFSGGGGSIRTSEFRDLSGAAIKLAAASGAIVERCVFLNNGTAVQATGRATAYLEHLTVFACGIGLDQREETPGSGAGLGDAHSLILWSTPVPVLEDAGTPAAVTYSDLTGPGVRPGAGNISSDPRFIGASSSDFRLSYFSPCHGAGRDGTDMGAIPYQTSGEMNAFRRCDTNADGENDIADAVFSLLMLFGGGRPASCPASADCNADLRVDISDVIFYLAYLFTDGPWPPGQFPACDVSPVEDCGAATCA